MGSESRTVSMSRSTNITASDTLTAGGSISITASGLTITAPTITLNAGIVQVTGMVQCTTLMASVGVVSPSYTPGAGNDLMSQQANLRERLSNEQSEVRAAALAELLQTGADLSPHLKEVAACISDPAESLRLSCAAIARPPWRGGGGIFSRSA